MSFLESVELSIKNILASKMRAFLTMLGIIIGVAAVILIVGLGNGTKIYMADTFKSLGTNTLNVSITGRGSSSRKMSVDEMYALVAANPKYLLRLSPTVRMTGGAKIGTESSTTTIVLGCSEDYFAIKSYIIADGRGLEYNDIIDRNYVCVVGSYIAETYFDNKAVGNTLKVGNNYFEIIGVNTKQGDSKSGTTDDYIFIPYSTAARLTNTSTIASYVVEIPSVDEAAPAMEVLNDALYNVFMNTSYYTVRSMADLLNTMNTMINIMVMVLSIVAGISLVVGGIGIMNIMLVSVTERTKEIGIRKALGAKERYILTQFVIEAATTSAIGGVLGIAIGYGLSGIATSVIKAALNAALPVIPTVGSVIMAFGISAGIGIIFGYLPAKKAASLNPIDALRND
jgi:putative ABC transport system permease protein